MQFRFPGTYTACVYQIKPTNCVPSFSAPFPHFLSVYLALDVWKLQNSVWKQDQVGGQESVLRVGGPGAPVSNPPCLRVWERGVCQK